MSKNGYVRSHVLVETSWVEAHMSDANVRLVEVDVDTTAFDTGHIRGAIGWNWRADLQRHPVRDIPDQRDWESLLSRSGIGNNDLVVLYGDNNNWFAAFAYWLFKVYGHADVCLMNGGRAKWLAEGREVSTDHTAVTPTSYTASPPNFALRAVRDQVTSALGRSDLTLIDVRSPKEFSGELLAPENLPQEGAQRGGHIPGARNIPWAAAVAENGTFKPAAELRAIYGGENGSNSTIAYCRIGERSAHTWFVLSELLGNPDVRNYDGSWTEWGSLIGAPIEQ